MSAPWAGYVRVSRVGPREETLLSPKLQEERIRQWAGNREVRMLPAELDQSGGKLDRPVLTEAIERVEAGEYAGLVAASLDRLSRSLTDALTIIRRVEDAGGQVVSVAENFDSSTPEGRMARNVWLSIAEMQLDRYREGFDRAKGDAVARGIHIAGRTPLGYRRRPDRTLEPDPRTASAVRGLFERRAGGDSWVALADSLGEQIGGSHSVKRVQSICRNPVYLGRASQGRHQNPDAHEPLVDRATWEAAQLAHPRPPRGKLGPALLSGIVRCAGCQHTMSPSVGRRGERIYRCSRRHAGGKCPEPAIISARLVEPYLERAVLEQIGDLRFSATERTRGIEEAEQALQAAETELAAYRDLNAVAEMGPIAYMDGMRPRVEGVQKARRALAEARSSVGPIPEAGDLAQLWPELTVDQRRRVLGGVLGVVWVRRGRGDVVDRVRIVAAGSEPASLSRRGTSAGPVESLAWDGDLPGEIRPTLAQDAS
jgi:DNA invertase Pin-like site-specific DNA recombinase